MLKPEWQKYLEQIKIHRPTASAIYNLICMGAMDEFIEAPKADNMPAYAVMIEEAKKALKSKAKLSKGFKTDDIVLANVENPLDLVRWRLGYNPISKTNLAELFAGPIMQEGFRRDANSMFPFSKAPQDKTPQCKLTTKLTDFLAKYPGTDGFNAIVHGEVNLVLFGLVVDVRFFRYQAGAKEAMKLSVYTGEELLEIVCWPDKSGSVPATMMAKIKKNQANLFQIKPQMRDGKATYRLGHVLVLRTPAFEPLTLMAPDVIVEKTTVGKDGEVGDSADKPRKRGRKKKESETPKEFEAQKTLDFESLFE